MDGRKRMVLRAVVEKYIEKAEPVGSKTLSEQQLLNCSPATLRNEMAALEELGYLEHPHTSAGRVPTAKGYRIYVNELMERHRLSIEETETINKALKQKLSELDDMLMQAGKLVSQLTHYTAFAAPISEKSIFMLIHAEAFMPDETSLVVVAVIEDGIVKTKLFRLGSPINSECVLLITTALNEVYAGKNKFTDDMAKQAIKMAGKAAPYMPGIIDFITEVCRKPSDIYLSGESHLLSQPEFFNLALAQRTLAYLSDKRSSLMALSHEAPPGNVRIVIGPENVAQELAEMSVVMASYKMSDGLRGLIGVVGPTRMDYPKIQSRLEYLAGKLGEILEGNTDL